MGFFNNVLNGVIDSVKVVIIALVCFVFILIGGYLLADYVGLVPEATGYHRSLSLQTFLTDLPFIGSNMIYLIVAIVLLVLAVIGIELYNRKISVADDGALKSDNNAKKEFSGAADNLSEIMTEPVAPKSR